MTKFNFLRIFLLTALIVAATQTSAFAANTEQIKLINYTGRTIVALECVAYDKDWNNKNLPGKRVLHDGDSMNIKYDPQTQYFKLRVTFDSGKKITWDEINFSDAQTLTLDYGNDGEFLYRKDVQW